MRDRGSQVDAKRMWSHRIQLLREKAGLTQRQLAADLNVSVRTVAAWENMQDFPAANDGMFKSLDLLEEYHVHNRVSAINA